MKHWLYLLVVLVVLVIFGCRWFGPSDLYDNDQPKTVAYTVDMVEHGRWVLPQDMLGHPATKPPMYNWVGVPAVAMGWHNEFALKLPSILAGLVTVMLTWWVGYRTAERERVVGGAFVGEESQNPAVLPTVVAAVGCVAVVANQMFMKLSYTARPDMVLCAFMVAGWVASSWLFGCFSGDEEPLRASGGAGGWGLFAAQVVLWLCVAGAGLTKGLPALLLLIYVLLGAKLIGGRWSVLWRTGVAWGLPVSLLLFGAWAYGAYQSNPEHFNRVFMGDETLSRIGLGGPLKIILEVWKMPAWFIARFLPWSLFALMGIAHVTAKQSWRGWVRHPVGPCVLWVVLVVIFFSFSGGKRADYLAPGLPAVAVLASFWLVYEGRRLLGMRVWHLGVFGLGVALLMGAYEWVGSAAAREGYGDRVNVFVCKVEGVTGGAPIRFEHTGYTPIQPLLGYNQPDGESDPISDARWVIKPLSESGAVVVSDPIWIGGKRVEVKMALYEVVSGGVRPKSAGFK